MTIFIRLLFFCLLMVETFPPAGAQTNQAAEPWIAFPSANVSGYGVYHFRKRFSLPKAPEKLVIHVSADNRYNLFVNGRRVCYGPAKGDLKTYKYDVIDIAPFLKAGENLLAALVYNGGKDKPLAFFSVQTAFLLRSEDESFRALNTDSGWKTFQNPAYQVISYQEMLFDERWFYGFYACGGGDDVNAAAYPWGWEQLDFDDSRWPAAELLKFEYAPPWNLVPRNIAFMDNERQKPVRIRLVRGLAMKPGPWNGTSSLHIPAHSKASILVDFEWFTMGYPELRCSGGAGSRVQLKYAEALYEEVNLKAHRDSVEGKIMFGVWDNFRPDGRADALFRPLWKRTFRYVQLNIETQAQPLEIRSLEHEYSGYPYPDMASFESNDPTLNEIFDMCLRTFRLCSGETYYDTPYYEQLSYGGDNRPIGAISVYNSTDDRLFREVMRLYSQSENKETGLMKSAYPSQFDFDQGTWSMAWIQSLHDYYYIRGDSAFIRPFIGNMERILEFYLRHLDENSGLIGVVKNRNFVDWSITKGNIPRANENREIRQSTLLTLYFAHTLDCAVRLYEKIGHCDKAQRWAQLARRIKGAVYTNCWDEEKQLFRDHPDQEVFSQHSNLMAILCDVIAPAQQQALLDRILHYEHFDERASSYFSFFLFKALEKTGREDLFLNQLGFWKQFLDMGHTTCGETAFASHDRSDCHAWSAHPAYFLLTMVAGIKSADIGFNRVSIKPQLGSLTSLRASIPHPKGRISVVYTLSKGKWKGSVDLPQGMSGTLDLQGRHLELKEGLNRID